jgi:anti-anti-sigma factor
VGAKLIDERSGKEYELGPDGATVGRHADNDISLSGRAVSRFHAEISSSGSGWLLEDHGSTYGTFLNGQKVEGTAELKDGDKIRLAVCNSAPQGEFNFLFRVGKPGVGSVLKKAARAIVNRRKVELGSMVFERSPGVLLVRLTGLFRRREIDALEAYVQKELQQEGPGSKLMVVLDLGKVQYMNSYGLAFLVKLGSQRQLNGSRLRVFGAAGTVLKLLGLAGPTSPVEQVAGEQEAMRTS